MTEPIEAALSALENARRDMLALKSKSDTGSLRNRQIEASAKRIQCAIDTLRHPAASGDLRERIARETWAHIERLLIEECGLRSDEGLTMQRPNFINAIKNGMAADE